jgi:anaerobic nitric oxide reductase flavorubredoxin
MDQITLAENVYWVGAIDWNIRDFHGYITNRGTQYNAYLIRDEKIALVDTVKHNFTDALLKNISSITNPDNVNYIIVNHVEPDHSSALPDVAKKLKNAVIVTSERGKDAIIEHYGAEGFKFQTVKTGDKLSLGSKTLAFIEAPMLHWPDSMFTYVVEDKILMCNDAFGQHFASSQQFDGEVDPSVLMEEAARYYANILMPFGALIGRKIAEVTQMGIAPAIIAPSHGVIWKDNPGKIVKAYLDWSSGANVKNKIVVVYDTMWNSTDKMARAITEGAVSEGVEVKLMKLRAATTTEAMLEILDAKAVIVGSPTLNNQMFPTVAAFMNYVTGLKPQNKLWSFFGSYGWGKGAVKDMTEAAKKAGFVVRESAIEVRFVPDAQDLKQCFELGKQIAAEVKAKA